MQIQELFSRKIDRELQGVITVGESEDANPAQELDEYVVTRELQKHFADFFSAYKKGILGTTPNGRQIWREHFARNGEGEKWGSE